MTKQTKYDFEKLSLSEVQTFAEFGNRSSFKYNRKAFVSLVNSYKKFINKKMVEFLSSHYFTDYTLSFHSLSNKDFVFSLISNRYLRNDFINFLGDKYYNFLTNIMYHRIKINNYVSIKIYSAQSYLDIKRTTGINIYDCLKELNLKINNYDKFVSSIKASFKAKKRKIQSLNNQIDMLKELLPEIEEIVKHP